MFEWDNWLLVLLGAILVRLWMRLPGTVREALERKERAQYQDLFESAPVAYHEIDRLGLIQRVNRAECELFGAGAGEILGTPAWNWVASEDREQARAAVREKLAGNRPLAPFTREFVKPNGERLQLEVHENLIRDRLGGVTGIRTALLDVTARMRAEQRLQSSLTVYQTLFEVCPLAILTLDVRGIVRQWNPAAERLLGWTAAEMIGREPRCLLPSQDTGEDSRLTPGSRDGLPPRALEVRRVRKDGGIIDVAVSAAPVRGARGEPVEWMCVLEDVTFRKAAADQLAESSRQLSRKNTQLAEALSQAQEATRVKGRFLANVSHEIRTPLNGIMGMSDLLLTTALDSEQRVYARTIRDGAGTLTALINDLLDLSKIEAGKMSPEQVEFDLRATVEEVAALTRCRAEAKGIVLIARVDEALPRVVVGDSLRIKQVLLNLVSNGIKFTGEGRVELLVSQTQRREGRVEVAFAVSDTGIGIPPDARKRIFAAFEQADPSVTRKYGGTGLGLAISQRLAALMGGEIQVESEVGKGSVFRFSLTLGLADAARPQPAAAPAPEAPAPAPAAARTVLLAEDNDVNRLIAVRMLEAAGCRVDTVTNGRLAVDAAIGREYDLILMDVQMPEMDGLRATAEIRKLEGALRHTPIVAMTAHGLAGDREQCLDAGMDDYLSKPVQRSEVLRALRTWAERGRCTRTR